MTNQTQYAIFTDQLDQICYSELDWQCEVNDLLKLGCNNIRVIKVIGEDAEYAIYQMDEILREKGRIGRKTFNKVEELLNVKVTFLKHFK